MVHLVIDVVTDIVCPWCYIGVGRLETALAELGDDVSVDLIHHPFFLDADLPPGGVDLRERLKRKYGGDPEAMFARVEAEAHKSGLPLDFAKVRRTYPTAAAHALIREARPKGTQPALARAMFAAYFVDGRDIADPDILAEIAGAHGFTAEEARRAATDPASLAISANAAQSAAASGIQGVPFFIFNQRLALSGCQPQDVFGRALERALQPEAKTETV